MAMVSIYDVVIQVEGENAALDEFVRIHLGAGSFSFNTILPTPPALEIEVSSFLEDGYDALFGSWENVAAHWMLKEGAASKGFPFPLASRDQVVECLKYLGSNGEKRLALGTQFKSNLDTYGYGAAAAWQKGNWGIDCDAEDLIAEILEHAVTMSFTLCGPFPKKIGKSLSMNHPSLSVTISYVDGAGKRGKRTSLVNGKETVKGAGDEDIASHIRTFRRNAGIAWLSKFSSCGQLKYIDIDDDGHAIFKGTQMSLQFALRRLKDGETAAHLTAHFPQLSADHVKELLQLAQGVSAVGVER